VGGLLGREEEEQLRQHLKRKHAASILSLKEEFMRARKKGKLPKDATSALKTWWSANLVWPYPTDDDKRILGDETGLHPTQINNCAPGEREWRLAPHPLPRRVHQPAQAALAQAVPQRAAHDGGGGGGGAARGVRLARGGAAGGREGVRCWRRGAGFAERAKYAEAFFMSGTPSLVRTPIKYAVAPP